ncbi:uncharacterized protein LOC117122913 [Anneissia japonica]|uniref:uncharacterized protein LOC117122913 n=1 Tax=Anneissia japonica TaxID=1529436 RepID=UPI0014256428|nr:uncharacterized protein LOC117122913 [Anneissia japonica]
MPTRRMEDKFRDFLVKLSGYFSGIRVRWLRCLLFDHIVIGVLARSKIDGIGLFNELWDIDEISCNNVDLLSEIAELTKNKSAISHVNEYKIKAIKKYVPITKRKQLTQYRKNLFRALQLVEEDKVEFLANSYQQHYSDFKNIWDLVFFLEKDEQLENKPDKIKRFGNLLNQKAKHALLLSDESDKREVKSSKKKKGHQSTVSSSSSSEDPDDSSDDSNLGTNGGQIMSKTRERKMQKWAVIVSICTLLVPILYGLFYIEILNSTQLVILFMLGFIILIVYIVLTIWPSSKVVLGKIMLAVLAVVLPKLKIPQGTTEYRRIKKVVKHFFK